MTKTMRMDWSTDMTEALSKQLEESLKSYLTDDPPDSEYQQGYLDALIELYRVEQMRRNDKANRLFRALPSSFKYHFPPPVLPDHQSNGGETRRRSRQKGNFNSKETDNR
jgi:hypothetical protein